MMDLRSAFGLHTTPFTREIRIEDQLALPMHQEALDGATPQERWDADTRRLRLHESDTELREKFVITETRKVSLDHVVSVGGVDYEVPRGHGGTRLAVRRHALEGTLSILHQGRIVRLHPVDLAANAAARPTRRSGGTSRSCRAPRGSRRCRAPGASRARRRPRACRRR